jgi:aspartyl-tRNA(Asn)/glutamyl-tRNA(Gln) amidotransferase subunit A
VISGADAHDQTSVKKDFAYGGMKRSGLKGKKLGVIAELTGAEIQKETLDKVNEAIAWYRNAGAVVETVSLPLLKYAVPAYYLISSAEASANLSRFDGIRYGHRAKSSSGFNDLISESRAEGFGWEVKRRIMLGSYALCSGYYDAYYKKAKHLVSLVREAYAAAFERYDALLSPVAPSVAYRFDAMPDSPVAMYVADICTVSAPLAGLPALSAPCGYTDEGLPVGLMITARRWDDAGILSLAEAFESEFKRVPVRL